MSEITVDVLEDTLEALKGAPETAGSALWMGAAENSTRWAASPRAQPLSLQACLDLSS
jgi:hypothetical protein